MSSRTRYGTEVNGEADYLLTARPIRLPWRTKYHAVEAGTELMFRDRATGHVFRERAKTYGYGQWDVTLPTTGDIEVSLDSGRRWYPASPGRTEP